MLAKPSSKKIFITYYGAEFGQEAFKLPTIKVTFLG